MLNRIVGRLCNVLETITGILFVSLFVLNIVQITLRYVAGIAWLWLPDVSRLLFIWVVFVGASILIARNEHLLMDFFSARLSPVAGRRLAVAIQIAQMALFAIMLVGGTVIARVRMRIPFDTVDLPTGWAYLAVPICAALMLLFSANNVAQSLASRNRHE